MARPLRLHAPGLIHHVMARGNARMAIYRDDRDRQRFLEILGEALRRDRLRCWAYCLMPNHYHLVVQTTADTLSHAMRQVNGVYAQWWNRRHGRVGHVTQGRFKAQVVQQERYLLAVCRYVLLNPVRAELVVDPAAWRWSSCAASLGLIEGPTWFAPTLLLDACGSGRPDKQRATLRRLLGRPDPLDVAQAVRDDLRVIGDEAFAARFVDEMAQASAAVPLRERTLGRPDLRRTLLTRTSGAMATRIARALDDGHTVGDVCQALGMRAADVRTLTRRARRRQNLPRGGRET